MPREGHKFSSWSIRSLSTHFNPHAPRGARPAVQRYACPGNVISIHVPREGHDQIHAMARRGARGARQPRKLRSGAWNIISIHVPREGHDDNIYLGIAQAEISIHVPREGHDGRCIPMSTARVIFQSTCPARGTTALAANARRFNPDFNPRAPRGARLQIFCVTVHCALISIHVPREGHDISRVGIANCESRFQSTCPARGTTHNQFPTPRAAAISIHVPREGHDTRYKFAKLVHAGISIHVPREGHDIRCPAPQRFGRYFNPRAPRGARPPKSKNAGATPGISIHVPREGHD